MVLSLLLACARHSAALIRAPQPTPIQVAAIHDQLDNTAITALPPALVEQVLAQLSARGLSPTLREPPAERSSARRLEVLLEGSTTALLIEAQARYMSQLSGRFRWVVTVRLTLAQPETTAEFSVPVFLQFQHQDAEDALLDAAPLIEQQLAYLLDEYLSGLQP